MLSTCPTCGYDLAGLDPCRGSVCPECGGRIDPSAIVILWRKACNRAWLPFFLSPLFALPGAVFYGVGQPILTFALATFFGYKALGRMDTLFGVRDQPLVNLFAAVILSLSWTLLSSMALGAAALLVLDVFGY